jgi:hypothetical protein
MKIPSLAAIKWPFNPCLVNVSGEHRILNWSVLEAVRSRRGGVQMAKWQRLSTKISEGTLNTFVS